MHASPEVMKAALDWFRLQLANDSQPFCEFDSYNKNSTPGFSQIAKPLTDLTPYKVAWGWGAAEAKIFVSMKVAMATAPVLRLPGTEHQCIVMTDARDVVWGAIWEEKSCWRLQPMVYASQELNATEIRYSACEREMFGIV